MELTKQDGILNRNQLKYLVILAMLIDHIAWAFVPTASLPGQVMHFIGRLTGPTMAYFVAEGYYYTRNVKKYALRLGIFALLSWIPFVYFEYGTLPIVVQDGSVKALPFFGVLYTLLLGLLAIWIWDKGRRPQWCKILGIIGLCMLSLFGDWAIFDVLWCLFLYVFRKDTKGKWIAFCCVGIFACSPILLFGWKQMFQIGIFMAPLLIQFGYNGQAGSQKPIHKWFFYVFYPAHLLVLGVIKWMM